MFPLCGEAMHLHSPIPSRDFTINAPSFPNNNFIRYQVLQWHHMYQMATTRACGLFFGTIY